MPFRHATRRYALGAAVLSSALLVGGCNVSAPTSPQASATPVEVGTVDVQPSPVRLVRELPGRVSPTRIAEVRARVSGPIVKREFQQGSTVREGDRLYQIDPQPFRVALDIAKAQLAKMEALALQARQQADRLATLVSRQSAAEAQNDAAIAARGQADAEVAAAKAGVERAKLDLDYATVRAPISGQVGRALVTEGAMIQAGTTHLATVQTLDPIYVDFTQSVTELSELRRNLESGELQGLSPDQAKLSLRLEDGTPYQQEGKLLFSDASVDPGTGQVTLRGEFANPRKELLPGMYVRGVVAEAVDVDAILIPMAAVQRTTAGASEVFVVTKEHTVERRPIQTTRSIDGKSLVSDGLAAGDRVVVDGFQKITPGTRVVSVPWTPSSTATAARR